MSEPLIKIENNHTVAPKINSINVENKPGSMLNLNAEEFSPQQ